ncbi:hypothetical protein BDK51DRAFT_34731, partial [Blyttiomyces helicus]
QATRRRKGGSSLRSGGSLSAAAGIEWRGGVAGAWRPVRVATAKSRGSDSGQVAGQPWFDLRGGQWGWRGARKEKRKHWQSRTVNYFIFIIGLSDTMLQCDIDHCSFWVNLGNQVSVFAAIAGGGRGEEKHSSERDCRTAARNDEEFPAASERKSGFRGTLFRTYACISVWMCEKERGAFPGEPSGERVHVSSIGYCKVDRDGGLAGFAQYPASVWSSLQPFVDEIRKSHLPPQLVNKLLDISLPAPPLLPILAARFLLKSPLTSSPRPMMDPVALSRSQMARPCQLSQAVVGSERMVRRSVHGWCSPPPIEYLQFNFKETISFFPSFAQPPASGSSRPFVGNHTFPQVNTSSEISLPGPRLPPILAVGLGLFSLLSQTNDGSSWYALDHSLTAALGIRPSKKL